MINKVSKRIHHMQQFFQRILKVSSEKLKGLWLLRIWQDYHDIK